MKLFMILSLMITTSVLDAATQESCRAEIGLVQANKLSQKCVAQGLAQCEVSQTCTTLIMSTCAEQTNDEMASFTCSTNLFNMYVKDFNADEICSSLASGDEMFYFTCRTNLYNGDSIENIGKYK